MGHAAIGTESERRRWMSLALVVTAQFMVILDATIVNVALPWTERDLGFAQENLQWVITAYAIMFGGTLLLGGRVADLLGRRRLLLVGLALFSFSSLLCGLGVSVFCESLVHKGLIWSPRRGQVDFTVPLFAEFLRENHLLGPLPNAEVAALARTS